jgi:hypothetical protein
LVTVYAQSVSGKRKYLCGGTNLKMAEWHWMMIQRNTEADQGPCTIMKIVSLYRLLVGKPEGRRPLRRPRRRWLDNIRMDLVEVGWGDVDWIGLAQDRGRWRAVVNSVLNLRVP